MTTAAIYTVCQHGMESHFYSYCAGGFSYPFHVGDWLSRLDSDVNSNRPEGEKLSVAALLPQFTGDYYFPEAAKGLRLFRAVSDSGVADWLGRTAPDERIPLHITLDLDRGTVGFVFKRNCPEADLPDLELPIYGNHDELGGSLLSEYAECTLCDKEMDFQSHAMAEVSETVFEQLIRDHAGQMLRQEPVRDGMGMRMG